MNTNRTAQKVFTIGGAHYIEVCLQQKSIGGIETCVRIGGVHYIEVFTNGGFTVFTLFLREASSLLCLCCTLRTTKSSGLRYDQIMLIKQVSKMYLSVKSTCRQKLPVGK